MATAFVPAGDEAEMEVPVPKGVAPGQMIQVQAPSGLMMEIVVPPGVVPGQTITVAIPPVNAYNGEDGYEAYVPLPDMRFDVSDPCEQIVALILCPCMGWQTKTLVLSDQEVTFREKSLCGTRKQKRPYAQLGSVDKHTLACGCHSLVSDFNPLNEKGEGGLKIGCCGTDEATVDKIVEELQYRKASRGGIAQIRKLDYVLNKLVKIGTRVPLLLHHMGASFTKKPQPSHEKMALTVKEFDVTNVIERMLSCTTRRLVLDEEEAELSINACFGFNTITSRREYGQLGFVEKQKNCICCFRIASDISPVPGQSDMVPGCPCTNRSQVNMLVRELRDRMAARGQVGQIKKQENILDMIADVDDNLRLLMKQQNLRFPPSQEEMKARFGENAPAIGGVRPRIENITPRKFDVTNHIDACLTCFCTCGIAGCTTENLDMKENDMIITVKNKIDDTDTKIPYAEMDSVDMSKTCCCCFSVNEQSPGYGCDKQKVEEMAEALHEAKTKRGNIAHLKQLRSMQTTAMGLDVMLDLLLAKEGVEYPPSQEVMDQIFQGNTPRALSHDLKAFIAPDKEFETKTYVVTNIPECVWTCCCCPCSGCTKHTMELGPDEMLVVKENWLSRTTSRTPYGNLGAVETETTCCCCTELPEMATPGCGCSHDLVNEIAEELQARKEKRGNIAQMKQQENIIIEVLNVETKLDVLMQHRGIQYPPAPEVMGQIFVMPTTVGKAEVQV